MKRPAGLLLTVLLSVTMLTGCWDYGGIERMIYLNALGVDYVDGKYVLYAQVIDFTALGKTEGGGGRQQQKIAIGKGIGNTFDEAAFDMYRTSQERTSWSHISALVFTMRAIKAGIPEKSIDLIRRYHEFRHTMWTYGTREPIEKLFLATPILGISSLYSRMTDPISIYKQSSEIQPLFLNRIISSTKEQAETTILPYLAIEPKAWTSEKGDQPVLVTEGVGVILNGQYKGFLDANQLKGLRWLQPKHKRIAVFSYLKGKPLAAVIFLAPAYKIMTHVDGDKVSFEVCIKAKGSMLEISQVRTESAIREQIKKQIEKEIRDTYEAGLDKKADVLNIGLEVYRQHPAEWRRLQKNAELPLTAESLKSVQTDINIPLTGRLKELNKELR